MESPPPGTDYDPVKRYTFTRVGRAVDVEVTTEKQLPLRGR